jgi:prepilin-type processing-associated H-X9-DG protein
MGNVNDGTGGRPNNLLGLTNYTGVAGANGKDAHTASPSDGPGANLAIYEGIFYNRSRTRIENIKDGSSNTLMFGEGLGGVGVGARNFGWTWMGVGALGTKFGLQYGGQPNADPNRMGNWSYFSSRHTGIVNFCFADGSVRGVAIGQTGMRNPIVGNDWYLLQQMSGRADGQTADTSSLLP